MEIKRLHDKDGFTVTINDGFVAYEYLLKVSDEICIHDIIEVLYKHFNVPEEKGKMIACSLTKPL